jgi:hypothetical protein
MGRCCSEASPLAVLWFNSSSSNAVVNLALAFVLIPFYAAGTGKAVQLPISYYFLDGSYLTCTCE